MSWGWSAMLVLFAGYLMYRAGLLVGYGRGYHEAMRKAQELEVWKKGR